MSLHRWLHNLRCALTPDRRQRHPQRHGSLRAEAHRPGLELLEDRVTPSFGAATIFPTGPVPEAVVAADFNNDGALDLVTASGGLYGGVSVLLGDGGGGFDARRWASTGLYNRSLAVGDFNNDGRLDTVTASSPDLSMLLGNGDGTFRPHSPISFNSGAPSSVAVGDFNNDGHLDLGVGSSVGCGCEYGYGWGYASVLLGNGDGSFASPVTTDAGAIEGVAVADVNGDGNPDFLTADGAAGSVTVLLGNGDGTLAALASHYTGGYPRAVAAGDLNGDGKMDLVAATENPTSNNVSVLLGDGLGAFGPAQAYASGRHASPVALGDVNKDGVLDITVPNYFDNTLSVLLGRGNGTFSAPLSFAAGVGPTGVVAGDFNGDGQTDVAVGNISMNAAVAVLLNDGDWPATTPSRPMVRIHDAMATEGNTDAVAATLTVTLSGESSESVTVAYATGNGTATPGSDYQAASGTLTFAPGETSKTITILLNGDRLVEPNETFVVNLSNPTNATIADGQGVGTIFDDEPRVSISDLGKYEGKKGRTTLFTFTVTLSAPYDQPVTMSFRTANGTATTSNNDYVAKTGTLTFAPGETTKTITIEVKGDNKREANEMFYLDLFGLSSNAQFTKNRGLGTILNDD